MIVMCEVLVDVIKHAFLAKFNEVKPAVYGGFLQSLCWQVGPRFCFMSECLPGCGVDLSENRAFRQSL
jgi:hypothetical protein